jgi:hypothetical protein
LEKMMKKLLAILLFIPTFAFGAVIATMPNQAGGKIVLTDEACIHNGKNYEGLFKAYFYTPQGTTGDGCWRLDDETVVVVWIESGTTRRYPVLNFDIRKKGNGV